MASSTASGSSATNTTTSSSPPHSSDVRDVDSKSVKESRVNTLEEKRRMRNFRKKKNRKRRHQQASVSKSLVITDLRLALENERKKNGLSLDKIGLYRGMSRTYWERWTWELQKRKEAIIESKKTRRFCQDHSKQPTSCLLPEINPSMLVEIDHPSKSNSLYIGRGSFGIVRVQKYRSILVAVKEYLPKTLSEDVLHEARILVRLCHPYVPCFLGVCMSEKPLRIVMQFEGIVIDGVPKALTLLHVLGGSIKVCESISEWMLVCAQLMEALSYLHDTAEILHNDIKSDNILLTKSSSYSECQIVVVDFGKATTLSEAKRYHLSMNDQAEYTRKYLHLAPEVISGEFKQSIYSDIYAAGGVLYKIIDAKKLDCNKHIRSTVVGLAEKCRSVHYHNRPKAKAVLTQILATETI